jgi:hypothetical protein
MRILEDAPKLYHVCKEAKVLQRGHSCVGSPTEYDPKAHVKSRSKPIGKMDLLSGSCCTPHTRLVNLMPTPGVAGVPGPTHVRVPAARHRRRRRLSRTTGRAARAAGPSDFYHVMEPGAAESWPGTGTVRDRTIITVAAVSESQRR